MNLLYADHNPKHRSQKAGPVLLLRKPSFFYHTTFKIPQKP